MIAYHCLFFINRKSLMEQITERLFHKALITENKEKFQIFKLFLIFKANFFVFCQFISKNFRFFGIFVFPFLKYTLYLYKYNFKNTSYFFYHFAFKV